MPCADLTSLRSFLLAIAVFALGLPAAFGQSRQIIDYSYDDAGNIVRVESIVSDAAPVVTTISPGVARREETVRMTATGSDLRLAEVTSPDPAVSISNVQSTQSAVSFDVAASADATPGSVTLDFTTQLGSTSGDIQIRLKRPRIIVAPVPLAVAPGQSLSLSVSLSNADSLSHQLTFAISDPTVAGTSTSSTTVVAGDTQTTDSISISGNTLGTTGLTVSSPELADATFTIFVTESFVPPIGPNIVNGQPLGVLFESGADQPALTTKGPFSATLSVVKVPGPSGPATRTFDLISPAIGTVRGGTLQRIEPPGFVAGAGPVTVTASGRELDAVTGVALVPPADVTLGTLSASPGGETATFTIDIDPLAETGERQLVFQTTNGPLTPATPDADRILIADSVPEIFSVEPIVLTRLTPAARMIIRGRSLAPIESIDITPSAGISLGTPVANAEGSEITLSLSVTGDAPLGDHVVRVTTPVGTSETTATVRNTLNVTNGPVNSFSPFYAAPVGVVKGAFVPPSSEVNPILAPYLGVGLGAFARAVMPTAVPIDTSFELVIRGIGLGDVTDVEIIPPDGITIDGPTTVLPDGTEVRVPVTVGAAAPTTIREVVVTDTFGEIVFSDAAGNRLRITAGIPLIESIDPNQQTQGATFTLTIRGFNLTDAFNVFAEPSDGIVFGINPAPAGDGTEVTIDMSVDIDATLGSRVIRVDSPAGVTTATPSVANTFSVISN